MKKVFYSTAIKALPEQDRPRERLGRLGATALSNAELIAIILGGGFQDFSALDLAQHLLSEHQGLDNLARKGVDELKLVKGIGTAKASQLAATFELGRRVAGTVEERKPEISSPEMAAAFLMPKYGNRDQEHVGILALDTKNRVIKEVPITVGLLDGSMIHPREVFRPAIMVNAAAVILFHNHPSGDPEPSKKDITITRQLAEAGRIMGMDLLDHIILTGSSFISMKQKGLMN